MPRIIEEYLALSPGEQHIVRSACATPDLEGALSLLRLYFLQITPADLRTLKEHIAKKPPA